MNRRSLFLIFSALSLYSLSPQGMAHTQLGSLGATATATDIYLATCQDDGSGPPDRLSAKIIDLPPVMAPVINLTVTRNGKSVVARDTTDGDAKYSPDVLLREGQGVYTLAVSKSARGAEIYRFEFHCSTVAGVHTGSSIVKKQDQ